MHKFSRIRQVAPMCPHGTAHWRHMANTIKSSICGGDAILSNQIKSNLFAINKMQNITVHKITFHLAGQTGDSFALMSAHKD